MYIEEIYKTAEKLLGDAPENLESFCRIAQQELLAKMRQEVSAEDCREAFIQAAAMIAASMYRGAQDSMENVSSYKAGSVSVTKKVSGSGGAFESLRRQTELIMSPYLYDSGFSFAGVRG